MKLNNTDKVYLAVLLLCVLLLGSTAWCSSAGRAAGRKPQPAAGARPSEAETAKDQAAAKRITFSKN